MQVAAAVWEPHVIKVRNGPNEPNWGVSQLLEQGGWRAVALTCTFSPGTPSLDAEWWTHVGDLAYLKLRGRGEAIFVGQKGQK